MKEKLRRKIRVLQNMIERFVGNHLNVLFSINEHPIFVLGNQKSGTTAIAALLGLATKSSVTLDIPKIENVSLTDSLFKGKVDFSEFIMMNRIAFSKDIIKEPTLTFFFNELLRFFPESKYIFVIRDPRDNIRSILDRCALPGNLDSLKESHLKNILPGWRKILEGEWVGNGQNYIEILASRWNIAAEVFLKNKKNFILIRYEDFLKDRPGEIYKLAQKVGLKVKKDIRQYVNYQYQSKGKHRGISWIDFFGNNNLKKIEEICNHYMKIFNYF